MSNKNPVSFFSLTAGSFNTTEAPVGGFVSGFIPVQAFSTINISVLTKSIGATLTIKTNSVKAHQDIANVYFTTTITADTPFFKRFIIPNSFFQVSLVQSSGTPEMYLNSSLNKNNEFSAFTFLNSIVKLNSDVALHRVGNDFQLDLVRGLHEGFTKVNIQGIQKVMPAPSTEETIGLGVDYAFPSNVESNAVMSSVNDAPLGTGAHSYDINGVLYNGQAHNTNYGSGTGLLGLNWGALNRLVVSGVGSGKKNDGDIKVYTGANLIGLIPAGENASHHAYYYVPDGNQMVLKDINIAAYAPEGIINIKELNPITGIEVSLGEFAVNTTHTQMTYTLDGLVVAGQIIKVNFKNTGLIAAGTACLINVNINGMLCPLVNSF